MTDAAIERLVTLADAFELWGAHGGNLISEAEAKPMADTIRTLLERVKALEGALEPFDQALENAEGNESGAGTIWESASAMSITFDDLRRARAALNTGEV